MNARAARVTIDVRLIHAGGIGTYLQHVVPGVAAARPSWSFTLLGSPGALARFSWSTAPNIRVARFESPIYGIREQIALPRLIPRNSDLFWAPHYNIPLVAGATLMVTIHDLCHVALPEGALKRAYARFMFDRIAHRANAIAFDSAFSRDEMTRLVGQAAGATATTPLGVDASWFEAASAYPEPPIPGPYLLYVGNLKRHKNVPALLRAFGGIHERIPHKLVLAGRREGLNADPDVDREAGKLGDRVVLLGEVDEGPLQRLVANATALVTASRYEGFGLPPLEAMAAGTACMVSRAGSLPEVCGDAALYCDPGDDTSIAAGLAQIATDAELRRTLTERGRRRAHEYTWARCVVATVELLDHALGQRRPGRPGPTG